MFSALITPMRADESIDYDALGALVEHQIARGVEGFYCCGSSGEAPLLSLNERRQVVRTVVDAAAGRVPVIAQVGTIRTADALWLAREAEVAGVAAVSLTPPYYYNFSAAEIEAYFAAAMEAVDLPVVVYNIPQFTRHAFDKSNAASLLGNPRVVGLKHTSQDLYALERLKAAYPEKVYFNGLDETYTSGLAAGVSGMVGTTVNVQPERFIQIREAFSRGDMATAQVVQRRVNDVVEALVSHGVFAATKYLVTLEGFPAGASRTPFRPLGEDAKRALASVYEVLAAEHGESGG
nr:dihydrodipicolinate synthase family protein [Actinomycetales bacterium]